MLDSHTILLLSCVCMCYGIDVRLVDAAGALSNVGLLQVKTDGSFGSVCGANLATADVVCRALGYAHGSVSSSACGSYGGGNLCGSSGTPVAMAGLTCSGSEWSLEECSWTAPDESCLSHAGDAVVYCSSAEASMPQGAMRLISTDGSASIDGAGRPEVYVQGAWRPICSSGVGSGASTVICKSMGFSGAVGSTAKCSSSDACGDVAPGISELACNGHENGVLTCPHEAGDDVFCAPSESIVVACVGNGETQGRLAKEAAPQTAHGK